MTNNKSTAQSGHMKLRLEDIDPSKSPAYSPNLYQYMKVRGHFSTQAGVAETVFVVKEGSRAANSFGAGALMIGFIDDGFLHGAPLIGALCHGAGQERMAHPIAKSLIEFPEFWDNYLRLGRCAIDPEHQTHFLADPDRYVTTDSGRTCLWCGHQQKKIVKRRIILDESWVTA